MKHFFWKYYEGESISPWLPLWNNKKRFISQSSALYTLFNVSAIIRTMSSSMEPNFTTRNSHWGLKMTVVQIREHFGAPFNTFCHSDYAGVQHCMVLVKEHFHICQMQTFFLRIVFESAQLVSMTFAIDCSSLLKEIKVYPKRLSRLLYLLTNLNWLSSASMRPENRNISIVVCFWCVVVNQLFVRRMFLWSIVSKRSHALSILYGRHHIVDFVNYFGCRP